MEIKYQDKLERGQAEALVHELLVESFGPEELGEPAQVIAELQEPEMYTVSAWDGTKPLGAAIGWQATHEVTLFSWLAVSPATRGHGVGTTLFRRVMSHWERTNPRLILGEIEDPTRHQASEQYGDPQRRWSLYQRLGAKYLDFPFAMPRLSPHVPIGDDMWLISFAGRDHEHIHPETGDLNGLGLGQSLREFLELYLKNSGEARDETGRYREPVERMLHAAASLE